MTFECPGSSVTTGGQSAGDTPGGSPSLALTANANPASARSWTRSSVDLVPFGTAKGSVPLAAFTRAAWSIGTGTGGLLVL
jgi:hypothetical protein